MKRKASGAGGKREKKAKKAADEEVSEEKEEKKEEKKGGGGGGGGGDDGGDDKVEVTNDEDANAFYRQLKESKPFFVMAGPCVIESLEHALSMAKEIKAIAARLGIEIVFKSSFDKANRTSLTSFRGPGIEKGLAILKKVKETYGLRIVTDVHECWHCEKAAKVVDILQIPAFLCRQTDLLIAAAKTGKVVNIKKGQFANTEIINHAVQKLRALGNHNILVCERGTTFGHNDLIVDPRSLVRLRGPGFPVVMDVTHSVQQPGGGEGGGSSGGLRHFIPAIARMAAAVGVDGFFFETHNDPKCAKCDGTNQWPLRHFEAIMRELMDIASASKGRLPVHEVYPYDDITADRR